MALFPAFSSFDPCVDAVAVEAERFLGDFPFSFFSSFPFVYSLSLVPRSRRHVKRSQAAFPVWRTSIHTLYSGEIPFHSEVCCLSIMLVLYYY